MGDIFNRVEKKYKLNKNQYKILLEKLKDYMLPDEYGKYTICNLYFDTDNYDLIRKSIEKPVYKEKLRLRSYGIPTEDSKSFLEIKKKYKGVVYKRRITLPLKESLDYIETGNKSNDNQIFNEIEYLKNFYNAYPRIYLSYDRIAFKGIENPSFRLTFDTNITCRDYDLDLRLGSYGTKLLDDDTYLMEVKILGSIPLWFSHILSDLKIYPSSFSKYGEYYKKDLLRKEFVK